MLAPDARLLIFTKAPVEGKVKTRLIPSIGIANATQLHRLLTTHVVKIATASQLCPVELWCSPDTSHTFFQQLTQQYPVTLFTQQGKDLGEKMFHAVSKAMQSATRVIIIGSDCLQFTTQHLQQALQSVAGSTKRVVLTPAQDGGYVLIGMNHIDCRLFEHIAWGSADVLTQTRRVLQQLGRDWQELSCLKDIDVESDLKDIADYASGYPLGLELNALLHKIQTLL